MTCSFYHLTCLICNCIHVWWLWLICFRSSPSSHVSNKFILMIYARQFMILITNYIWLILMINFGWHLMSMMQVWEEVKKEELNRLNKVITWQVLIKDRMKDKGWKYMHIQIDGLDIDWIYNNILHKFIHEIYIMEVI